MADRRRLCPEFVFVRSRVSRLPRFRFGRSRQARGVGYPSSDSRRQFFGWDTSVITGFHTEALPEHVGQKGHNLARMWRAGLPAPSGFCVTWDALDSIDASEL